MERERGHISLSFLLISFYLFTFKVLSNKVLINVRNTCRYKTFGSRTGSVAKESLYLPSRQVMEHFLVKLMGVTCVLSQTVNYAVHTFMYPCIYSDIKPMVRWVVRSILHGVDPLSYFSLQPVLHDWCNKGCGMCYPVCGMVHFLPSV